MSWLISPRTTGWASAARVSRDVMRPRPMPLSAMTACTDPVDLVLGGVRLARDLQPPVHPGQRRTHGRLRLGAHLVPPTLSSVSRAPQMRETSLFGVPGVTAQGLDQVVHAAGGHLVRASTITVRRAWPVRRRRSSRLGKKDPVRALGIARSRSPTCVVSTFSRSGELRDGRLMIRGYAEIAVTPLVGHHRSAPTGESVRRRGQVSHHGGVTGGDGGSGGDEGSSLLHALVTPSKASLRKRTRLWNHFTSQPPVPVGALSTQVTLALDESPARPS